MSHLPTIQIKADILWNLEKPLCILDIFILYAWWTHYKKSEPYLACACNIVALYRKSGINWTPVPSTTNHHHIQFTWNGSLLPFPWWGLKLLAFFASSLFMLLKCLRIDPCTPFAFHHLCLLAYCSGPKVQMFQTLEIFTTFHAIRW